MTDQTNLELVWAATGGVSDPGDEKYGTGWEAEIPTYQNFNFSLKAITSNILSLAERGVFIWQTDINYLAGQEVAGSDGKRYYCHTDSLGTDPVTDALRNFWSLSISFGDYVQHFPEEGMAFKDVNNLASDSLWQGNDQTIHSLLPVVELRNANPLHKDWLLANSKGELVVVDVGVDNKLPDGRSIVGGAAGVYRIYHEGNLPTLGTSAALDAQASLTDNTADRLLKVGAGGLLATTKLKPTLDLDTYPSSGNYAYDDDSVNAPSPENGIVHCEFRDPTSAGLRGTQKAITTSGALYSRNNVGGVWSVWKRTDPQAFGLGISQGATLPNTNLDLVIVGGVYNTAGATNGLPSGVTSTASLTTIPRFNGSSGHEYTQVIEWRDQTHRRYREGGTWSAWKRIDPQAFGVGVLSGGAIIETGNDLDTLLDEGRTYQSSFTNGPSGVSGGFLSVTPSHVVGFAKQRFTDGDTGGDYARNLISGTWSAWERKDPQAFGLGGEAILVTNLNTAIVAAKYYFSTGVTGAPSFTSYGHMEVIRFQTSVTQIAYSYLSEAVERRYSNDSGTTWSEWDSIVTESSLGGKPVVDFYQYQQKIETGDITLPLTYGRFTTWFNGGLVFATGGSSGKWAVFSTDKPYNIAGLTLENSGDEGTSPVTMITFTNGGQRLEIFQINGFYHYFDMATPWDLGNLGSVVSGDIGSVPTNDVDFSDDGLTMLWCYGDQIKTYSLITPFELRDSTQTGVASIVASDGGSESVSSAVFTDDGKNIIYSSAAKLILGKIYLPTPWNATGGVRRINYEMDLTQHVTSAEAITFNASGSKIHILSNTGYLLEMATSSMRVE